MTKFEQDWLNKFKDRGAMELAIGEYKSDYDYVGPEDWRRKAIPRTIYGVDVNLAAYRHDYLYVKGGTQKDRFDADAAFLADMCQLIEAHDWGALKKWFKWLLRGLAFQRAMKYFLAVRAGGKDIFEANNK
jgi:hypothetical protein